MYSEIKEEGYGQTQTRESKVQGSIFPIIIVVVLLMTNLSLSVWLMLYMYN